MRQKAFEAEHPDPRKAKRLENHLLEEERWSLLSLEEQKKINELYPGGYWKIPLEVIRRRPILEEKDCGSGVKYKIYDKIHQVYCAVISSPARLMENGVQGVIVLREEHLDFETICLRTKLERVVSEERIYQIEWPGARRRANSRFNNWKKDTNYRSRYYQQDFKFVYILKQNYNRYINSSSREELTHGYSEKVRSKYS